MFSFSNSFFLWFLPALGIPVILHLINRPLPRVLVFPSLRFIRKTPVPEKGKRKLRDLLILLLRLLAMACFILGLAGMSLKLHEQHIPAQNSFKKVVIVDCSVSMSAANKNRVNSLLKEEMKKGDVTVIFSSNKIIKEATGSEAASFFKPQNVAGNHSLALNRTADILDGQNGELVIISDFQSSDWKPQNMPETGTNIKVTFRQVETIKTDNTAITNAQTFKYGKDKRRITCEVRNYSDKAVDKLVTIEAGKNKDSRTLKIPRYRSARINLIVDNSSTNNGLLSIDSDSASWDNTYRVWLGTRPTVKILCIIPNPEQDRDISTSMFFFQKMMAIEDDMSAFIFDIETVLEDEFFTMEPADYQFICLFQCGGNIEKEDYERLKKYVENGGSLLRIPGRDASQILQLSRMSGLSKIQYVRTVDMDMQNKEWNVGWLNPDSYVSRLFKNPDESDLFQFSIRKYLELNCPEDAIIHLRIEDSKGVPFLVQEKPGRGSVYTINGSFNPIWNDLVFTSAFLPLIQDMIKSSVPADFGVKKINCGQVPPDLKDAIQNPLTPQAGIFEKTPFEMNINRIESTPERADLLELKTSLQGEIVTVGATANEISKLNLRHWLFLAALILLLVELFTISQKDKRELALRA